MTDEDRVLPCGRHRDRGSVRGEPRVRAVVLALVLLALPLALRGQAVRDSLPARASVEATPQRDGGPRSSLLTGTSHAEDDAAAREPIAPAKRISQDTGHADALDTVRTVALVVTGLLVAAAIIVLLLLHTDSRS